MIDLKTWIVFVSALVPLITGAIWYSKFLFGNALARSVNVAPEDAAKMKHSPWVFVLTYVFGVFLSGALMALTIHQIHFLSLVANDKTVEVAGSEMNLYAIDYFNRFGSNFRTFKHGAFHGTLAAIMIALPVTAIIAMFEGKGFKYIAIHTGYWIVTLALMGGIVCGFM